MTTRSVPSLFHSHSAPARRSSPPFLESRHHDVEPVVELLLVNLELRGLATELVIHAVLEPRHGDLDFVAEGPILQTKTNEQRERCVAEFNRNEGRKRKAKLHGGWGRARGRRGSSKRETSTAAGPLASRNVGTLFRRATGTPVSSQNAPPALHARKRITQELTTHRRQWVGSAATWAPLGVPGARLGSGAQPVD